MVDRGLQIEVTLDHIVQNAKRTSGPLVVLEAAAERASKSDSTACREIADRFGTPIIEDGRGHKAALGMRRNAIVNPSIATDASQGRTY
jgi:hypothetical protein